jgi:hypothetical protein
VGVTGDVGLGVTVTVANAVGVRLGASGDAVGAVRVGDDAVDGRTSGEGLGDAAARRAVVDVGAYTSGCDSELQATSVGRTKPHTMVKHNLRIQMPFLSTKVLYAW